MENFPGYQVISRIYQGSKTLVYRAKRLSDGKLVIIKKLKSQYPPLSELLLYQYQYAVTKNLDLPGIVVPHRLDNRTSTLILEDFGGISLKQYTASSPLNLDEFFQLAVQTTFILEGLYAKGIIHQAINPCHLLINPQTQQVKLTDFSRASVLPKETQPYTCVWENLAYLSPEQTGRTNRSLDYRTDFYSLGVTFYQLLTGKLPFQSTEPMELVYCHLARQPVPPRELNSAIPQTVSEMILKLLSKIPEKRYQTAWGVRADLKTAAVQWKQGNSEPLSLGTKDICDRFTVSEQLYGREREVKTLLAAFDRVSRGNTELVLVSGFSGIGKTALINEVHIPIVQKQGYFIRGKFDQLQRSIPLLAIVQVFRDLVQQLLSESPAQVQQWQAKLKKALGENGQVITSVVPELELLIGKQIPVPNLNPSAAQKRFHLVLKKFVQVLISTNRPLVIFLDDLQWADLASLQLIQLISETSQILLIGAYRDNEVNPAHPLMLTLEKIRAAQRIVTHITLPPLAQSSLNCLIADTLSCSPTRAFPLAELVFQKTQGNPFFAIQFLNSLYQEGAISFNWSDRCWQCDLVQVKTLCLSNNVVEFVASRLQKLPEPTQALLKLAACIGNQFDLKTLALVCEQSVEAAVAALWQALHAGLIIPTNEVYKFLTPEIESAQAFSLDADYKFLHDRVQQAAYSLIREDEKTSTHLRIGRLLLSKTPLPEREAKIFAIVNQLNVGAKLIATQAERDELAQLNLIAGRRAKTSTAYAVAFNYLRVGLELLDRSWQQYDLALALHLAAAEAAYLINRFEQMEQLASIVEEQARSLLDKVKLSEIKILAWVARSRPLESVKTALQILPFLGVTFPLQPSKGRIAIALLRIEVALWGKTIEDLLNLPYMTQPNQLAAMRIMGIMGSPAYNAVPDLMPLIALKGVDLSLKYGNAPMSAYGYASYGVILCGALGRIDTGYRFGQLALNLLEKLNAKELQARTFMVFNNFIRHWKEHVREGLSSLLEAYQSGLETGDVEFAAYSAYIYCYHSYFLGKELTGLNREMASYGQAITQLGQETALNLHKLYQQVVLILLGQVEQPWSLVGSDGEQRLSQLQQANHQTAIFDVYFNQLILCYLFGQYPQALENAAMAQKYLEGAVSTFSIPLFHFYDSLSRLALFPVAPNSEQKRFAKQVKKNQKKLKKWADSAPANHLHKFYLVEAEQHRVLGQNWQAVENYDRAIQLAKENEYLNEEALGYELAAKFYLSLGKEKLAQVYLLDAYYCYARWGAKAKLEDFETRYSQLLHQILPLSSPTPNSDLDLAAVFKASQALSEEIQPDRLVSTLLKVVIANTGAEKAAFVLFHQKMSLEAVIDGANVIVLPSIPAHSNQVPVSIINYVTRTSELLVLDRAVAAPAWAADPYIAQYQPQSVLCAPIFHRSELVGILYLENNLTAGAFTKERQETLTLLCSQAAISLLNASLYQDLKKSEAKQREKAEKLEQSLKELQKTQVQLLQAQKQLQYDAFHDFLTGLPNRAWFIKLLEYAIQLSRQRSDYQYAVLFLDLDSFKAVNDHLGHLFGDELLKSVATSLKVCLRSTDTVARFGGDEFAFLLELQDSREAVHVAQRIHNLLSQPFNLKGHDVSTGVSIGIALGTEKYTQPEAVLRDADAAMYQAKAQGKGCYSVYGEE